VLWAGLLATMYVVIVAVVLAGFHVAGLLTIRISLLPALLPIAFVAGSAFGALGPCFTPIVPPLDHMNLPIFLLVLPMGLLSSTYFPLPHPPPVAPDLAQPPSHPAPAVPPVLICLPRAGSLAGVAVLSAVQLGALVPLDLRLLRRRVLGD